MSDVESVKILVEVFKNKEGAVRSVHRIASPEDVGTLQSWPSGGLVQVSHALFVEALRRECYTTVIAQLSSGTELEDLTIREVSDLVKAQWLKSMEDLTGPAAEEALAMVKPR